MKKMLLISLLFIPLLSMELSDQDNSPLLSMLINNTDEEIYLGNATNGDSLNNITIKSYDIENGKLFPPVKSKNVKSSLGCLKFKPKTKNLLKLAIPTRNFNDSEGRGGFLYLNHKKSQSLERILLFNRIGQLMEANLSSDALKNLYLSNNKISIANKWIKQVLGTKIIDAHHYAIEVNKDSDCPKLFNVYFSEIPAPDNNDLSTYAKASILNFKESTLNDGCVIVTVNFDNLVTLEFLDQFINAIKSKDLFQRYCILTEQDQIITFTFYTDITQNEFQELLDSINNELK